MVAEIVQKEIPVFNYFAPLAGYMDNYDASGCVEDNDSDSPGQLGASPDVKQKADVIYIDDPCTMSHHNINTVKGNCTHGQITCSHTRHSGSHAKSWCHKCYSALGKACGKIKNKKGLKMAHINVRSLPPKIEEIRYIVNQMDLDVLCINETWLDGSISDTEIDIDGYFLLRKDRNRNGGGVCMYVSERITFREREDLYINDIEALWVEIKASPEICILVCSVYRPPAESNEYFDKMLDVFDKASLEDSEMCILGDLNYDYSIDLSISNNPVYYLENLYSLKQLIEKPTRVTQSTKTIIDVILSSLSERHSVSDVAEIALSDHFLLYTCIDIEMEKKNHKTVRYREYKNFNESNWLNELRISTVFKDITTNVDLLNAWQLWKIEFNRICNEHAPIKEVRVKQRCNPWISSEIIKLMYQRDYAHKKAVSLNSNKLWSEYKSLRNKVTSKVAISKKYYLAEVEKNYCSDPKKMWKKINRIVSQTKKSRIPPDMTANAFNEFYANVGKKVSAKCHNTVETTWKNPDCIYKFSFNTISRQDVLKQLQKLDSDSCLDVLDMDSKLLKLGAELLCDSLTHLFNLSLETSVVPSDWKLSRITPIYKGKGCLHAHGNYRPISVVGVIGKLMERNVYIQLLSYITDHHLISLDQFAFLKNHSTQTSLHRIIDDWLEAIDSGEIIGVSFLDIEKCFDTINHNILLRKLEHIGIQDSELFWFKSYLADRSQLVRCNGEESPPTKIDIGVPQGSILGPILFLIYINDIVQHISSGSCNMYADDIAIYATGNSTEEVNAKLQRATTDAYMWYEGNKLSVNINKSNVMLIGSSRQINDLSAVNLSISLGEYQLNQIQSTKYLGVTIDNNLTWNEHVGNLSSKISRQLITLRRASKVAPKSLLEKMYKSNIMPTMEYACSVWGCWSVSQENMIHRLQKRAARIITNNYDFINTRGDSLMTTLKLQPFSERVKYFTRTLMYKAIHGTAPFWLNNNILMACESHNRDTRNSRSMNVCIPNMNREFFKHSFQYRGAIYWNQLPEVIKEATSINAFKRLYKTQVGISCS